MSEFHGYRCDACGKEALSEKAGDAPPREWIAVLVHDGEATVCSSACARHWLTGRERDRAWIFSEAAQDVRYSARAFADESRQRSIEPYYYRRGGKTHRIPIERQEQL